MPLLAAGQARDALEGLSGRRLNGRWTVVELVKQNRFQTGSCFSIGYKVKDDAGTVAFAKVLDFSRALQEPDSADALNRMTEAYLFERELLKICSGLNLTKVIKGLDYGEIEVDNVPLRKIYFIISEIAECDVRKYMAENGPGYLSWRLAILHDVATGLSQLHKRGVYHQDLNGFILEGD